MNNVQIGKMGEEKATEYLLNENYKIIDRNYRCKYGEIDIIAKHNDRYVFVEVKTRKNKSFGLASEAVNKNKLKKIQDTSLFYIKENQIKSPFMRFDVIEIYYGNNLEIKHIKGI